MAQVGDHPAGNLMQILRMIIFALRSYRMTLTSCNIREMSLHRLDRLEVHQRIEAKHARIRGDIEDRRL